YKASQAYWPGAPIRVGSYTIYYSISALNHEDYTAADHHFTVSITAKEIVPTIASNHTNVTYSDGKLSWKYGHSFALSHITITPDELYTVADGHGQGTGGKDLVTYTHYFKDETGSTVTNLQAGTYTLVIKVAAHVEDQNNNRNYTLGTEGYQIQVLVQPMELSAPNDIQLPYTGEEVDYPVNANALYEVESYSAEHIHVGSYTVTFKIKDTYKDNYVWLNDKNTATLEITPAVLDVVVKLPTSTTYTGGTHELRITFSNAGESYSMVKGTDYTLSYEGSTGTVSSPINADTYSALLTLSEDFTLGTTDLPANFSKTNDTKITGSFTISKASISVTVAVDHEHYYSGTDYNADGRFFTTHYNVVNALTNGVFPKASEFEISYLGTNGETALLDASTYTVSYKLKGLGAQNYAISNGDSDILWTSTIEIQKAQVDFELSDTTRAADYIYNQNAQNVIIKFNNLSGTTALPTHYEISYKLGSTVCDFKNVGTYEVIVELTTPDTKNFELTGTNPTVEMKQATILASVATTAVYKGVGQEPTIRFTWDNGDSLALTKNTQYSVSYTGTGLDASGLPKNVNADGYTVTITIEDENYTLSNQTYTFKITKAKITIRDGEYRYVGKAPTINPVFVNAANPTVLPTQYSIVSYKDAEDTEITVAEFVNVGKYHLYIALSGDDSDNFDLVDDCYIVTIIPQTITSITWYNSSTALPSKTGSIAYNKTSKNITARGTFGDRTISIPLVVEIVEGESTILNAGTYKLKASVPTDNQNFTAISNDLGSYTLVVSKAIVELVVEDNEVEYNKEEQSATISFSGTTLPAASDYSVAYTKEGYSSSTGATNAGEYVITVSFAENGNYAFTGNALEATDTFTISKAMVSFSAENKVYNGQGQEATLSFTWKDGEEITFVKGTDYTVSYEGNVLPKDVNTNGYVVTITLSTEATKNYDLVEDTATMRITPKSLSVTGNGVYKEVYGESGTSRSKSLSEVPNLALSGVEATDTVTSRISFVLPGKEAKTYSDVPATITISGASAKNYQLASSNITITVEIQKREITVSGTATYEEVYGNPVGATRTYTAEELELTLGNTIGNDNALLTVDLGFTLSDLNAGTYTIQNENITFALVDDEVAKNYSIGQTNVTISFEITQAQVKAQFSGNVHTYDDTAYTPEVQFTYGTNNIYEKLPQSYTLTYQTQTGTALTEAPKNVGDYKIVVSLDNNYIFEGTNAYEYSIEKCTIYVTGIQLSSGEAAGWVYDATIHTLEFDAVYNNPVDTKDPNVKVSLTTPSANAGTYSNLTPVISWSDEDNFDVDVEDGVVFSLTISKAQLSLEAIPTSKPYIGYKTEQNYYSEDSLKEEIQIRVDNSTVSAPSYSLTYNTDGTYETVGEALKFVDTYEIKLELSDKTNFTFKQSSSLGGDNISYLGSSNNRTGVIWTFEITPAQINTKIADSYKKLEYTAEAVDIVMTFKHSDETAWGNEELESDIVYSLKYYTDSNRTQEISAPKNVGTYYVRIDFTRGNYELVSSTAANRVFEITPKILTITPNVEKPFTWVYDGNNDKEFILGSDTLGATMSGVYSTDDVEVSVKLTAKAADVNTYKTTDNSLTTDFTITGDASNNYSIPSDVEEFILNITKAEATVVWELKDDVRDSLVDGYHFTYDRKGRINRIIPVITHTATGLSEEANKEVKKNNVVVNSMIDAGTYILTAIYEDNNYSLANETITIYVDPYSINQSEVEALIWVNR
ncbi:MAG: hypothetical protein K2J85_03735, partial [Anaeroplasmataceae bacterium]|nr:hypothetical protein [Anaeroplasmataceae bacterium]